MTIKIIENAGSLSEDDLALLAGTELITLMMRNRIMIVIDNTSQSFDWVQLTSDIAGFYHIRELNKSRLYQVWFEHHRDLDQFKKNLYIAKMSSGE